MNCLECQEWLQRRFDGEALAPSYALDQHLTECVSCRTLHACGDMLLKTLETWPAPAVPVDFSQRLVGRVMKDRQVRQRRVRLQLMVTAALAASILVMALAGYLLLPIPESQPKSMVRKDMRETPVRIESTDARPGLVKSAGDARQAALSLSERWADLAKKQTRIFLAAATPVDVELPNLAVSLEPAAQSLQQAGEEAFETLQPMATSARRAFDYFLNDLPAFGASRE